MNKNNQTRTEIDSLGAVKVPKDAYYGVFTTRALKNFQINESTAPTIFAKALGIVKLAAAKANYKLKLLTKKHFEAIEKACNEFIEGKFDNEFKLDIFQAGAGTSYNMNANEIIANRANELLGGKKGTYKPLDPNNHINMAQSTNDVIPTALRVATLMMLPGLIDEITALEKSINKHAKNSKNVIKVGRTHLQDAVPISLGRELNSYTEALAKSRKMIESQAKDLSILGIGGTAVGTGINSDPKYKTTITKILSNLTEINFSSAKNLTEISNNLNSFLNFSAALRSLAVNLLNFSRNLKLMNSGPKGGLSEISLPEVQPGSSIMPGKVNPSIPECMEMVCFSVLGNDRTIELSACEGHFELNVNYPIVMPNILDSMKILTNGMKTLRTLAVDKMKVNKENIKKVFEESLCTATALSPHLGYQKTAKLVKSALKKGITIKEEILGQGIMNEKELSAILSHQNTTKPSKIV